MIDHLVYATNDVDETVADVTRRLGVEAAHGGRHLGFGTRNALLSLGPTMYLEIIGPDEGQHRPTNGYWYGVENIVTPRLVTWTARVEHLERVAAHAHGAGYNPGDVHNVFRELPDGSKLSWRLTWPTGAGDGLVPNLIEWDEGCPHPAATSPGGVELLQLRGYHPAPESIQPMLDAVGVQLELRVADVPKLVAILDSPYGPIELS
ncbi:MAG: VOC family protein [Acidimicrobiia bacterium]|nr:VOC family protein [Acidimicrobiia bacterium]MDX2467957.1 VOC family protein [Acidimicrobiia bacterium]